MSFPIPESVTDFLQQTYWWVNKDGFIPISEMSTLYRRRAAHSLLRRARLWGLWDLDETDARYATGFNEVQEFAGRVNAPKNFMCSTPLYLRLIEGGADPQDHHWIEDDD